jgi:hypothetical protein
MIDDVGRKLKHLKTCHHQSYLSLETKFAMEGQSGMSGPTRDGNSLIFDSGGYLFSQKEVK